MTADAALRDMEAPQLAVKVAALEGQLALLSHTVSTGHNNTTSTMAAMQADLRDISKTLTTVAQQQHELQSHSEGLNRAFSAIEKLGNKFERWVDSHERDNRLTSDAVTKWDATHLAYKNGLRAIWIVFGLVGLLATWWMDGRFAMAQQDSRNIMQIIEKMDARIERLERRA